ncbi:hypothetical protein HanPSC8_Chr16g0732761 [Helianthus annuus]|nr:hypothetical protein HanPSC8_Chr16g0732761 [Helianthus annuus]
MCLCMMVCTFEVFAALPFKLADRTVRSIGWSNRSVSIAHLVSCHSIGWHARSGDIPMFRRG